MATSGTTGGGQLFEPDGAETAAAAAAKGRLFCTGVEEREGEKDLEQTLGFRGRTAGEGEIGDDDNDVVPSEAAVVVVVVLPPVIIEAAEI